MNISPEEDPQLTEAIIQATNASRGHFRYESGHHGNLWFDLDRLFLEVSQLKQWSDKLAGHVRKLKADLVCGPISGGAFLAQLVALKLGVRFAYANRQVAGGAASYSIPETFRPDLDGAKVLLVDDAINAASAVQSMAIDLMSRRAELVGMASLVTLGDTAEEFAELQDIAFCTLVKLDIKIWEETDCELCRVGKPVINVLNQ